MTQSGLSEPSKFRRVPRGGGRGGSRDWVTRGGVYAGDNKGQVSQVSNMERKKTRMNPLVFN